MYVSYVLIEVLTIFTVRVMNIFDLPYIITKMELLNETYYNIQNCMGFFVNGQ